MDKFSPFGNGEDWLPTHTGHRPMARGCRNHQSPCFSGTMPLRISLAKTKKPLFLASYSFHKGFQNACHQCACLPYIGVLSDGDSNRIVKKTGGFQSIVDAMNAQFVKNLALCVFALDKRLLVAGVVQIDNPFFVQLDSEHGINEI